MKYITLFETAAAYNAATLDLPNVSLIEENMGVHYNPWVETRVVTKYNVTSTSSPTVLRTNYDSNIFKSMEIDGIMLDELVTEYTFDTIGEHTVKYELYDETKLGLHAPVFNNNNLIECIIPNNVTTIYDYALYGCTGLTNIIIPDSVTSIGVQCFQGCSSLTSITIGNGVTSIGANALGSTNALKILNYNAKCKLDYQIRGGILYNLETVIIGDSTPSIGYQFFNDCRNLTSVTIGNSVTSIGSGAFQDCSNLTSIVIPDSVTSIDSSAFHNCSSLTSVTIGNGVTSIGSAAFNGCTSLTSVTIGNNVTSIGIAAFANCSFTSIDIPSGVTSIGEGAFSDCGNLTSIEIPSSVISIGGMTFNNCSSLASIVSNATTAPTIVDSTFKDVKTDGILTVPTGSTGYDTWMSTGDYYLGKYNWTKVEQ